MKNLSPRLIISVSICLSCQAALAGGLSYSTDFDGVGNGDGFTIDIPSRGSRSHGPSTTHDERSGSQDPDARSLRQTYEEQRAEAQKKAEAEALRQKLERARRKKNVAEIKRLLEELLKYEADEPSVAQRMKYTQEVLELEKRFAKAREEYLAVLPSYRSQLAWSLDHGVVPPPAVPKRYKRILLRGMWNTPEEARQNVLDGMKSPFNGLPYDDVFAFGTSGPKDLARAAFDHLLGNIDRLSPETNSHLSELKGATVDELVCHSNGCRVAEVLIATGQLKVNRLRMLGGDSSLLDLGYLRELQEQNQLQELTVYATKGDLVPFTGAAWPIISLMRQIGHPLMTFDKKRNDLTYQALGLVQRPNFNPDERFQVRVLTYPAGSDLDVVAKHEYQNYSRMIDGWRRTKCLNTDGTTHQRCIIH